MIYDSIHTAELLFPVYYTDKDLSETYNTADMHADDENEQVIYVCQCFVAAYLMSSSVTMKALHSGCVVLSQTPGFFSTAADSWPVMGAALVCRALAMADRRVLSVQPGPTPEGATRWL